TKEEAFLFRRLLDGPLKGAKVKMHGRSAIPAPAGPTMRIKEIDDARVIVIVASDIETDVPIIDLRVKKAVSKRGAKLIVVYPEGVNLDRDPHTVHIRNQNGGAAEEVRTPPAHETSKIPGGHSGHPAFGEVHRRLGSPAAPGLRKGCGSAGDDLRGAPGQLHERRRHCPVPASAHPDPVSFERRMGSAVRACDRPRPEGRL